MHDIYKKLNISPRYPGLYILNEDFHIFDVKVPKGYVTNGADIPSVFTFYQHPFDPLILPAVVVHDYFCTLGNIEYKLHNNVKKAQEYFNKADRLFIETLIALNRPASRVFILGTAVVLYNKLIRYPKMKLFKKSNKRLAEKVNLRK
jgi:hypothetical protein